MRKHSVQKIKRIKELRAKGWSINELVEKFSVPKTTVWHHIHDIVVLPEHVDELKSKRGGNTVRKKKREERAMIEAEKMLKGANREFLLAMAMLYWSEGSKKTCDFINSDGDMVRLYLKVVRRVLKISNKSLRMTLRIFSGMDEKKCLDYWSKITQTPRSDFLVRMNDGGTRGRTKYGLCRVTVLKGSDTLKLIHAFEKLSYKELIKKKVR